MKKEIKQTEKNNKNYFRLRFADFLAHFVVYVFLIERVEFVSSVTVVLKF